LTNQIILTSWLASGKRQAASGKRQAASGKRQAASGKRQTRLHAETESLYPLIPAAAAPLVCFSSPVFLFRLLTKQLRALCSGAVFVVLGGFGRGPPIVFLSFLTPQGDLFFIQPFSKGASP
jgi:hypothetical protein